MIIPYECMGEQVWEKFLDGIMKEAGIEKYKFADAKNGIYEKRTINGDKEMVFIFNISDEDKTFDLGKEVIAFGADAEVVGNRMTVKTGEIGYAVVKAEVKN
ncbi:MAG: hypothetical protein J6E38_09475 [Clostridia bacterium]|nr:hypothetical protein [Clostridia bacterium]MBO5020391.1 hypothetical protein [Clostridia bacterium]